MVEYPSTLNQSCAHCAETFLASRRDAHYCSGRCRQAAYRLRVTASTATAARCCIGAQPTQTYSESNGATERGNTTTKAVTANNTKAREAG
jgi:ribosomal protein S27AE